MSKTVLVCRSGGGPDGLQAHAGIRAAMEEAGIVATHCAGTSAGAIASAFDASGRTAGYYFAVMNELETDKILVTNLWRKLRMMLSANTTLFDNAPIVSLIHQHLPDRFRYLQKPLTLFATDGATGMGDWFDGQADDVLQGLRECVLASMSISGVFPPVAGFTDGGTWNNCALPANWREFDEVWICIATGRDTDSLIRGTGFSDLLANIQLFGRGQIAQTLLQIGAIASGSQHRNHDALEKFVKTGIAVSGNVRVIWPAYESHGFGFRAGLSQAVYRRTVAMLREMGEQLKDTAQTFNSAVSNESNLTSPAPQSEQLQSLPDGVNPIAPADGRLDFAASSSEQDTRHTGVIATPEVETVGATPASRDLSKRETNVLR